MGAKVGQQVRVVPDPGDGALVTLNPADPRDLISQGSQRMGSDRQTDTSAVQQS